MLRKSIKMLALAAVLGLSAKAQALQIFFSTSGTIGQESSAANAAITTAAGGTGTLYIWAIPSAADGTIQGFDLNIRVGSASFVTASSSTLDNPSSGGSTRWSGSTSGGTGTSTRATLNNGVYKNNASDTGSNPGIGLGTTNSAYTNTAFSTDAEYDSANGAFKMGSFTYTLSSALAPLSTAGIFLQVGGADSGGPGATDGVGGKIVSQNGNVVNVFMGTGDTTAALGSDKGGESQTAGVSTADATITVLGVPEPTSLSLLGLGAVGLIRRRRQA